MNSELLNKLIEVLTPIFSKFFGVFGWDNIQDDNQRLIIIFFLTIGVGFIVKGFKQIFEFHKKRKIRMDLFPIIQPNEFKEILKYYISTKGQNISPSEEQKENPKHTFTAKENLINYFLDDGFDKENDDRHFLILGESGMGKTTFLLNLFIRFNKKNWFGKTRIKYFPFGNPETMNDILAIKREERPNIILLIDALDESPEMGKNYKQKLQSFLKKAWNFKKIVITCRTQFFPSEQDELYETGTFKVTTKGRNMHFFKKIYLSTFDDNDINLYLRKKYPKYIFWKIPEKKRAINIVKKCPNLMIRPLLLSYIDVIVNSFNTNSEIKKLLPSDIYNILVRKWIERESLKTSNRNPEEFKQNMKRFSEKMALDIFLKKNKRKGLLVKQSELMQVAKEFNINLSELEIRGKSLLSRDASGRYKFAHKSILEYLLAVHAASNNEFAEGVLYFKDMKDFSMAKSFYQEILINKTVPNKA